MKKIFADHFREREDGSTIPLIALTCFVMFGAIAFIADVGLWDSQKFDLQVGTDLAALSAGHSIIRDEEIGMSGIRDVLDFQRAQMVDGDEITFTAQYIGDDRLRVTGTRPAKYFFSGIFGTLPTEIRVSSTILADMGGKAMPCVLALESDPSSNFGIRVTGGASITATKCAVHSNSEDTQSSPWAQNGSIYIDSGSIDAESICAAGEFAQSNSGSNHVSPEPQNGCSHVDDPLADFSPPTPSGTVWSNPGNDAWWPGTRQLEPGIYPDGLVINNGKRAMMQAGVYFITGGDFVTENGGILQPANGVSVVMLSAGRIRFSDGSTIAEWRAPKSGDMEGIAFYRDPSLSCSQGARFDGGTRFKFDGIAYFAGCDLDISNNAQIETRNDYTYIIADTISLTGSAGISLKTDSLDGPAEDFSTGGEKSVRLVM